MSLCPIDDVGLLGEAYQ